MGNIMSYRIFDDGKKNINESNKTLIDKNKKSILNFSSENLSFDKNYIRNKEKKKDSNDEKSTQEPIESDENFEIEKIKKENFYLFDESLNSNNVKHPCHAQWFLFWVFASYLNENFSESEKENAHFFYSCFPDQCIKGKAKNCFTEFLNIYPIRAETREELMMWLQMCENYCRKKADLPLKLFNYKKLLKRWRYDDEYV